MRVAAKLGFGTIPPMSASAQDITRWLRQRGPLMCDGFKHVTVIAGIREWSGSTELLVYDPDRPQETAGSWRDLNDWYYWDPFSGRDTQKNLQAIFYYAL